MPKHIDNSQLRLFAAALYQIRVLLAGHVGSGSKNPETAAAELAYALHNQALAALESKHVDVPGALDGLTRLEPLVGATLLADLRRTVLNA
ncbi:hypothetical protein, partial [Xanthomonas arboricola]|uniref:hypothetical protein n=1 Tax=Xanthomonas arboricola TaxID=56448 RepID=UPI0035ED5826